MAARTQTRKKPARSRGQQTRARLMAAGRTVFAAKGLGGASLREDILAGTGISSGSFYHQFTDKTDLLVQILRADGARILETMEQLLQRPGTEVAREVEAGRDPAPGQGDPATAGPSSGSSQAPLSDAHSASRPASRSGRRSTIAQGRALLRSLFEMSERHPEFMKIYVREYYSDSKRVRQEIRSHSERTIAYLKSYYDDLAQALDLPLDTEGIARMLSIQSSALINYYLDVPESQRDEMRETLIEQMLALTVGGLLAIRKRE